ncbi:uncharacterized protein LOC133186999 [Saccostrea echinata]|uniref:uncharacterized protein LOC133186999 n=1 Tax=Saccostrea echinata TaxID=191078 RepID=UPI002A8410A7|nr:uncharacterized protein LOC133186999 [Saccostrea echinata]
MTIYIWRPRWDPGVLWRVKVIAPRTSPHRRRHSKRDEDISFSGEGQCGSMTGFHLALVLLHTAQGETQTGSCKDMLQGYLTGQLSSALGVYQVEALRREFKSFTDLIEKSLKEFKEKVNIRSRIKNINNKSIEYTRWGKKICPSNAKLVYSGFVGGSYYTHTGAAVEPLCLPRDPEWGIYRDGNDGTKACVYGAEYILTNTLKGRFTSLQYHDVPCAVCLAQNRSIVKMFPARKTCYKGWNLEYQGYLMAGCYGHAAGTTYKCVDENPDTLHGGQAAKHGYLFYFVEGCCGSLKCPPYVDGRELVCAVCSKK